MNVDDFIYRNIGFEQTENIRKSISSVIGYLKDNNFIDSEIERVLLSFKDIEDICVDNLPEYLWNDSLLQKGIFMRGKKSSLPVDMRAVQSRPQWELIFRCGKN